MPRQMMSEMAIFRQLLSRYFPFYFEYVTACVASATSSRRLQKYIAIRTETNE